MIPPVSERLLPYMSDHKVLLQIEKMMLWRACNLTPSIPRGVLMWNRDSPVSIVSLHWWPLHDWSLWPRLRRALSDNVIIPLDLTQLFCPGFTLTAGPPSGFTTDIVSCWGGSPGESLQSHCIHTQFHCSSGPPVCFPSRRTWLQSPGGYLCETGILLLALSRYNALMIWKLGTPTR
jgi:hypothetical protein